MRKDEEKDEPRTNVFDGNSDLSNAVWSSPDPAAAPTKSDELVDAWFAKHFHGLGTLLSERLHNIIHAAKEDLKAELRKL